MHMSCSASHLPYLIGEMKVLKFSCGTYSPPFHFAETHMCLRCWYAVFTHPPMHEPAVYDMCPYIHADICNVQDTMGI